VITCEEVFELQVGLPDTVAIGMLTWHLRSFQPAERDASTGAGSITAATSEK
jgi:hypothetical protein